MTVNEFKSEFEIKYGLASKGAPDLNNYEMSLFLTQAVRDIVDDAYRRFEDTEYIKRALSPLIKEQSLSLINSSDFFKNIDVKEAITPADLYYILQENVTVDNQCGDIEVISEDLDNLNKTIKNPFRKPNKRKVIRTQIGPNKVRLYSSSTINDYKIKYIKKYNPIILSNFTTDPDLIGSETIDGKNTITNTELPVFLHDKIVARAVVLAIKTFRQNDLNTQIQV